MSTFERLIQKQIPEKQTVSQKIKCFWLKHGEKVVILIGVILIALFSFEAGFLKGQKDQKEPVAVNQTVCPSCPKEENNNTGANNNPQQNSQKKSAAEQPNSEKQNCAFAASKNSNKYHLASCQFAAKIKPENKICFSSKEEAESRGYQGAQCCLK